MKQIDIINNLIKMIFINISLFIIYIKIIEYKPNSIIKIVLGILASIVISIIYNSSYYYNLAGCFVFIYIIYGIIIGIILQNKVYYSIIVTFIAFIITYLAYLISTIITGIILRILVPNIDTKNFIVLFIIMIITIIIMHYVLKIKRLKNGFNFLKDIRIKDITTRFTIFFWCIMILIFALLQGKNTVIFNTYIFTISIFVAILVIYWLKSQITKHYKTRMRDRTIEIQKNEIDEKDRIIENVKNENLKLATAVHKYNHRLSALENAAKRAVELDNKTEFAEEISNILKEAKEISEGFSKEVEINQNKTLPLTNIIGIDNMFKYMQEEANKNNIEFNLKLNESINYLVENTIPKDKLEIMIGDHIKDAIIAINASNNSYKSILVILGMVENCYEFSIYDTGIEFEIETLLKLGKEPVTTHKDTGGSGIGFMTTFETLKDSKASLQIEEYNTQTTNYTKCVTIRFDGKNQYRIYSYRAEQIRAKNNEKSIIIKNIN